MMPNLRGVFLLAASTLLSPCAASAQAQNMPSCTSAIQVRFDKYGMTHIPAVRGAGAIHSAFQRSRNVDRNVRRVAPRNHSRLGLERGGLFAVRRGWVVPAQAAFRTNLAG
jgi:hypothetical protein